MRFMIMVFGEESDVRAHSPEWAERVSAFMVELDDQLAATGELVFSEVLEFGASGVLIDRHGRPHGGSLAGRVTPLSRFWVVKSSEERATEIAAGIAETVGAAVEIRRVQEASHRP